MPIRDKAALEIVDELERSAFGSFGFDAQEIVDLADKDDQGNTRCEAGNHRRGDKGNKASQAQQADQGQQRARDQPGDENSLQTIFLHQDNQHRAHRAGWTGNLVRRAGECANDDSRQNCGHQPGGSSRAGGDTEGQGQGQRNSRHR